ncbi:hypothetical protein DERF_014023 [Dermatophagoides farinae]|uniref:Uncharacterized protein n=1 Tax=Dermatophagoides farinae TaxID=6954 RepID=A0A922KZF6_DERFA|nr:hypothetical protein DERF_014023 [Dermatophagoides farinae]
MMPVQTTRHMLRFALADGHNLLYSVIMLPSNPMTMETTARKRSLFTVASPGTLEPESTVGLCWCYSHLCVVGQ